MGTYDLSKSTDATQIRLEVKSGTTEHAEKPSNGSRSRLGLIFGGVFGATGILLLAVATPFILPALRRHCLPYVPATDIQLSNIANAIKKHAKKGDSFLDIGSGDGRICRLAAEQRLFAKVHGVELNYLLVLFSRLKALTSGQFRQIKYYHNDLWRFPINNYDVVCIFGVDSMMGPLEKYLKDSNTKPQRIIACRFPFSNLTMIEEIGSGIDTVWIYRLTSSKERVVA